MIKPQTWKHEGVFGQAEVHVGPRGMVGLNGVMHFGLSVRLDEEFSGAGLIDLDTARWLADKLQQGIALVDAAVLDQDAENFVAGVKANLRERYKQ